MKFTSQLNIIFVILKHRQRNSIKKLALKKLAAATFDCSVFI